MASNRALPTHPQPSPGIVLTKAASRAADRLAISSKTLAAVIGVSEATVSRMKKDGFALEPGTKPFELAALFVRLFRSLDAIAGGDESVSRAWLNNPNTELDGRPVDKIRTVAGLVDILGYLDARRARL